MISAAIIAQDEEKYISRVLVNIYDFVDEIVIVDGGSKDRTIEIAKSHGDKVKVVERKFELNFGDQKNFALDQCRGDWILVPDCDEFFDLEFLVSINELIKKSVDVFLVKRHTVIENIFVGEEYQPRLLRKGIRWEGDLHEGTPIDNSERTECKRCMYHNHTWNRQHFNNRLYQNILDGKNIRPENSDGFVDGGDISVDRDSDFSPFKEWKEGFRRISSLNEVHS